MAFVQACDLCPTCRNFYLGDGECALGYYRDSDKIVIECDEYLEGEPMCSYFDELEKQRLREEQQCSST